MQQVELEIAHLPHARHQPVQRIRAAAEIEHQAALGIARPIDGLATRNRTAAAQELQQRPATVEAAGARRGSDDERRADPQLVPLPAEPAAPPQRRQLDVAGSGLAGGDTHAPMEPLAQVSREPTCLRPKARPSPPGDNDACARAKRPGARLPFEPLERRDRQRTPRRGAVREGSRDERQQAADDDSGQPGDPQRRHSCAHLAPLSGPIVPATHPA
jgi:hypothetical protein